MSFTSVISRAIWHWPCFAGSRPRCGRICELLSCRQRWPRRPSLNSWVVVQFFDPRAAFSIFLSRINPTRHSLSKSRRVLRLKIFSTKSTRVTFWSSCPERPKSGALPVNCQPLAAKHNLVITPLHGDLTPAEQDRAVSPSSQRKVILSTNVAESSITIEGVTAVIDSGLARIARDSPWTGLPTLEIGRVSKASATQRAGRAARTAPGRVIRLYTLEDFKRRPEHDAPEITRRELSELCLNLRAMGIANPRTLEWLDAPPEAAVSRAEDLLERLGATRERARTMARYPLHPRLARLVLEAVERGAGEEGCAVAGLLSSGARADSCDLLHLLDSEWDGRTRQHVDQIRRIVKPPKQKKQAADALPLSILAAFPDRVARRRKDNQLLLASPGSSAILACESQADFLVAVDIEDRTEHALPLVRMYCAIQPEWLIDLFPDRVRERSGVEWNRAAERVDATSALLYDGLVIEETRSGSLDPEPAAALLAERALELGIERFVDRDQLDEFLARVSFAAEHAPVPKIDVESAFSELCRGRKSFAELRSAAPSMIGMLEQRANPKIVERSGAQPGPSSERPSGADPLRGRQATVGSIASARLLRPAGNAAHRKRQGPASGSSVGAESSPGPDHRRPGGFLGAALSTGSTRAEPPLSEARMAGKPVRKIGRR